MLVHLQNSIMFTLPNQKFLLLATNAECTRLGIVEILPHRLRRTMHLSMCESPRFALQEESRNLYSIICQTNTWSIIRDTYDLWTNRWRYGAKKTKQCHGQTVPQISVTTECYTFLVASFSNWTGALRGPPPLPAPAKPLSGWNLFAPPCNNLSYCSSALYSVSPRVGR